MNQIINIGKNPQNMGNQGFGMFWVKTLVLGFLGM
jgi:hypothetical protein